MIIDIEILSRTGVEVDLFDHVLYITFSYVKG